MDESRVCDWHQDQTATAGLQQQTQPTVKLAWKADPSCHQANLLSLSLSLSLSFSLFLFSSFPHMYSISLTHTQTICLQLTVTSPSSLSLCNTRTHKPPKSVPLLTSPVPLPVTLFVRAQSLPSRHGGGILYIQRYTHTLKYPDMTRSRVREITARARGSRIGLPRIEMRSHVRLKRGKVALSPSSPGIGISSAATAKGPS